MCQARSLSTSTCVEGHVPGQERPAEAACGGEGLELLHLLPEIKPTELPTELATELSGVTLKSRAGRPCALQGPMAHAPWLLHGVMAVGATALEPTSWLQPIQAVRLIIMIVKIGHDSVKQRR
jgi:hypothetical protein